MPEKPTIDRKLFLKNFRQTLPAEFDYVDDDSILTLAIQMSPKLGTDFNWTKPEKAIVEPGFFEALEEQTKEQLYRLPETGAAVVNILSEQFDDRLDKYDQDGNLVSTYDNRVKERIEFFESARKITQDWMKDDTELQAYQRWAGNNPFEWNRFFEPSMLGRVLSSTLTSMGTIYAAGTIGSAVGTLVGLPQLGLLTGAAAGYAMEGSEAYGQAYDMLKDRGITDSKIISQVASDAGNMYGLISGVLEVAVPAFVSRSFGFGARTTKAISERFVKGYAKNIASGVDDAASAAAKTISQIAEENISIYNRIGAFSKVMIPATLGEAGTEGLQYLTEEAILENKIDGTQITPDWMMEKMSTPEFKESVAGGLVGGFIGVGAGVRAARGSEGRELASGIIGTKEILDKDPVLRVGIVSKKIEEISNYNNTELSKLINGLPDLDTSELSKSKTGKIIFNAKNKQKIKSLLADYYFKTLPETLRKEAIDNVLNNENISRIDKIEFSRKMNDYENNIGLNTSAKSMADNIAKAASEQQAQKEDVGEKKQEPSTGTQETPAGTKAKDPAWIIKDFEKAGLTEELENIKNQGLETYDELNTYRTQVTKKYKAKARELAKNIENDTERNQELKNIDTTKNYDIKRIKSIHDRLQKKAESNKIKIGDEVVITKTNDSFVVSEIKDINGEKLYIDKDGKQYTEKAIKLKGKKSSDTSNVPKVGDKIVLKTNGYEATIIEEMEQDGVKYYRYSDRDIWVKADEFNIKKKPTKVDEKGRVEDEFGYGDRVVDYYEDYENYPTEPPTPESSAEENLAPREPAKQESSNVDTQIKPSLAVGQSAIVKKDNKKIVIESVDDSNIDDIKYTDKDGNTYNSNDLVGIKPREPKKKTGLDEAKFKKGDGVYVTSDRHGNNGEKIKIKSVKVFKDMQENNIYYDEDGKAYSGSELSFEKPERVEKKQGKPKQKKPKVKISNRIIEGDIWEQDGIPIIPTNTEGVHGAGLANQAFKRGKIKYKQNGIFSYLKDVVTFPVKYNWREKANLSLINESADKLIGLSNNNKDKIFLLPLIGMGHGEASLESIKPIIDRILANTNNVILVIPREGTNTGKKGTARTDRTKQSLDEIRKAFLGEPTKTQEQEKPKKQKKETLIEKEEHENNTEEPKQESSSYSEDSLSTNDDTDIDFQQADVAGKKVPVSKDKDIVRKIVIRLRKHYPQINIKQIEKIFDEYGVEVAGRAFKNVAEWSENLGTIDTIPHEVFHIILRAFANDSIVKMGIKQFTVKGLNEKQAAEELTELVGQYYANTIKSTGLISQIKRWLNLMSARLKKIFNPKKLSSSDIATILGERMYAGKFELTSIDEEEYNSTELVNEDNKDIDYQKSESHKIQHDYTSFFSDMLGNYLQRSEYAQIVELAKNAYRDAKTQNDKQKESGEMIDGFSIFLEALRKKIKEFNKVRNTKDKFLFKDIKNNINSLMVFYQKQNSGIKRFDPKNDKRKDKPFRRNMFTIIYKTIKGKVSRAPHLKHIFKILDVDKNLSTNKSYPSSYPSSFIEDELMERVSSGNLEDAMLTYYLNPKDIHREVESKNWENEDGSNKVFYFQSYEDFSEADIKYINSKVEKVGDSNRIFVFVGAKGGDNSQIIITEVPKRFMEMNKEDIIHEFMRQVNEGLMTEEHMNNFIRDAEDMTNASNGDKNIDNNYRRLLARHRYIQLEFHDSYLMKELEQRGKSNSVRVLFDRRRISHAIGFVIRGLSKRKVMILDKEKIRVRYNGETRDLNDFDGFMMYSGETAQEIERLVGQMPEGGDSHGLDNIKMFIRERSDNGIDFAGFKMMNGLPFQENWEFIDENGDVIAYVDNKGRQFKDKNDNIIHFIATDNEAKWTNGIYDTNNNIYGGRGYTDVIEMGESAFKVNFTMSNKSKEQAAFPLAAFEMLYSPSFEMTDEALTIMKEYIDLIGDKWMDKLLDAASDPKKLHELIYREPRENEHLRELQHALELDKSGKLLKLHNFKNMLTLKLNNMIINNGLYKLRNPEKGYATQFALKPKAFLNIDDGSFMVGAGNTTLIKQVTKMYRDKYGKKQKPTIEELNDFLQEEEFYQLIVRQPISKSGAVILRRLQGFVEGHGDSAFLNKEDVQLIEGDYDGDKIATHTINQKLPNGKSLEDLWLQMRPELDRRNAATHVELKWFDKDTTATSHSNNDDIVKSILKQVKNTNAEGKIINAKVIASIMALKNFSATMKVGSDTYEISIKQPDATVTMTYLQLRKDEKGNVHPDVLKEIEKYNKISGKDSIKVSYINDKPYLETTLEHEFALLLQMVLDDRKFGHLGLIKKYADSSFLESRMFDVKKNGESVSIFDTPKVVRKLAKDSKSYFNHSPIRQGKSDNQGATTLTDSYDNSRNLSIKNIPDDIKERIIKKDDANYYQTYDQINKNSMKFSVNDNVSPIEYLIKKLYDSWVERNENQAESGMSNPFDDTVSYENEMYYKIVNEMARISIARWYENNFDKMDANKKETIKEEVRLYLVNGKALDGASIEFYKIFSSEQAKKAKKNFDVNYDYNEEFLKHIEKHRPRFLSMSEDAQIYASVLMLTYAPYLRENGKIGYNRDIFNLQPLSLMHPTVILKFSELSDIIRKELNSKDNIKLLKKEFSESGSKFIDNKILTKCGK